MELTDKPVNHWFSAEMLVAYHFCLQDYRVSVPLSPCSYDMVIDTGKRLVKIQVKKAMFQKQRMRKQGLGDRDHWMVELSKHKRKRDAASGYFHKRIEMKEFDYLAAVCNGSAVYVIPVEKLASKEEGLTVRMLQIKVALEHGRLDSIKAGERFDQYRNNFNLEP